MFTTVQRFYLVISFIFFTREGEDECDNQISMFNHNMHISACADNFVYLVKLNIFIMLEKFILKTDLKNTKTALFDSVHFSQNGGYFESRRKLGRFGNKTHRF